jgi:hypothetical protein
MVLVMTGVSLALRRARATRSGACHQLSAAEIEIHLGLTRDDLPCRLAYHGTVEAETDAFDELRQVRLGEGRVGTCRTDLQTFHACLDTVDYRRLVDFTSLLSWMKVQHPPNQVLGTLHRDHWSSLQ